MKGRKLNRGMTLVELLVVVAIIAVLAGMSAVFISGSRNSNAQSDLYNEVFTLFQAQRMRATSMSLATYIEFEATGETINTVVPYIGKGAYCSASDADRVLIRYRNNSEAAQVAIDIANREEGNRSIDSEKTNKYVFNGTSMTEIKASVKMVDEEEGGDGGGDGDDGEAPAGTFAVCFQPNGQVAFIRNGVLESLDRITFTIDDLFPGDTDLHHSAGTYQISITSLGMLESSTAPRG